MRYDALVIGAGPAGSAAARLLARAGWRVALVEKTVFPRRKVCGEFVSATSMAVLDACGIGTAFRDLAGPPVTRIGLYAGETMLATNTGSVWGRALGRDRLDTLLRDAAVAAGAELFQPADVVALCRDGDGHAAMLADGRRLCARIAIAACGSWNTAGPFALAKAGDMLAFKARFTGDALPRGLMPLLAFPGGYGGLVHSDSGHLSLSCCIRRTALARARARHHGKAGEAVLAHIRETTRGAALALNGAVPEGPILSVGPIHPGIRPRHRDGIFHAGNSTGEAHPVVAEGISMAIQGAGLLARLLIEGRGAAYGAAWWRAFAPRLHAASLFAHLAMNDSMRAASLRIIRGMPALLELGARLSGKAPVLPDPAGQ